MSSWLLKSKRLRSAGQGATASGNQNPSSTSSTPPSGSIYNGSSNLSNSSINLSQSSSQHHIDAGDDMVRQFAASHIDTQKSTFIRWVNVQLANSPNYTPMTSIERDLRDGKRLVALLETVSKEPLKPERGNMRIHQMANVAKVLSFLEKRTDEALTSIGNEDIVDGNLKLTLGLVWIIIYRFQIQQAANSMLELYPSLTVDDVIQETEDPKGKKKGGPTQHQVDAKQALLRWVRYQLEDYSDIIIPIQDFHRSWRTGLAFAALIHRHDPDFLPEFYSDILLLPFETTDELLSTLNRAFEVAYSKMGLPRLLDPGDLIDVEAPDERSVMTYVSEYYIIMSDHQMKQDPALAEELRARRLKAKDERLALLGEDELAHRIRLQEEEEQRRREEQEELDRIHQRRQEIEGWSLRAREEEEALRKKREEELREQREQELASQPPLPDIQEEVEPESSEPFEPSQPSPSTAPLENTASPSVDSVSSESEHDYPDADTDSEPVDPKEQESRQLVLEGKLTEYYQGIDELLQWVREQDETFPQVPDTTALLDRAKDLEPLTKAIEAIEMEQVAKEHIVSHFHDVREELKEFVNPDLTPEQISDVDKKWWELESLWNAFTTKVAEAKEASEEIKWIIDCSQEITRVNDEISKFEAQLEAFAEKRAQETPQDRCQKQVLEQQDYSLTSISFLLQTYLDFLTSLMDPKVHHYTAPDHLTALNNELTQDRLPRLRNVIEQAQRNLANDRLLRIFLDLFEPSEEWIGESIDWLANIEVPDFVSQDHWNGGSTVQEYLTRNMSLDLNLDNFQSQIDHLKNELGEEQTEVNEFRSDKYTKLTEQAEAVKRSVAESQDVTAEETTKMVDEFMDDIRASLVKVETLLPQEAVHCAFAARVLDYLWDALNVLDKVEETSAAIDKWEMKQPDAEVEALVIDVEGDFEGVDSKLREEQGERTVRDVVQARHAGLSSTIRNLRDCFLQKQKAIHGDRQMKDFLERTLACQATLKDFKSKFEQPAPLKGFGTDNVKPFDDFTAHVHSVGESFDKFEGDVYADYLETGVQVKAMAACSNARQDPAVVQSKLDTLNELLNDVKTLKADRERDTTTVAECRKLAASLTTLRSDLETLENDFSELEHLEPHQENNLVELGHRMNQLNSQFAIMEQDNVFHILAEDPSCSKMLKEIAQRQESIQKTQDRLKAKLEVKQQWDMAWEAFDERTKALQKYLDGVEQTIRDRGFVSLDILADDASVWKKSEDAVHEGEVANGETVDSLKEFKASRMPELSTLANALEQVIQLAGGLDHMDNVRAEQFHESERLQKGLQDYLQQLDALNDQEKLQLDTLKQRLAWSQHVSESKADVDALRTTCEDTLSKFTELLKACDQSGDTSGLNKTAAEQLKQQAEHLISLAAKQKQDRYDTALNTFSSLKELVLTPNKDLDSNRVNSAKTVPAHLESELAAFKLQYDDLDQQLDYVSQLAEHALQVASHLEKNDAIDIKLGTLATELKSEEEASQEPIDKAAVVRVEVQNLSKELQQILSNGPRPVDNTEATLSQIQNEYPTLLESLLKKRLDHTEELNDALTPLLADYEELLRYQNGLRALAKELENHGQWLDPSNEKVRQAGDRIQALFSEWPTEDSSRDIKSPTTEALKKQSDELSNLQSTLAQESAHIEKKVQEFESIKQNITQALQKATIHSKHLQHDLEKSLDSIEDKIQELKTDMRHKAQQLECLEKQLAWEQEMARAKTVCQELDNDIVQFTTDQAMWKATEGSSDHADTLQQLELLDKAVAEFEERLQSFEDRQKPKVNQVWADVCGATAVIGKGIPKNFETRQDGLSDTCQALRAKVAYSAEVVKQRKALENMNARIRELERLRADLASRSVSDEDLPKDALPFKELEARIRSLAQELENDFASLSYPVDDSSDEARAKSEASNEQIRAHVQSCRAQVEATKQLLDEAVLNREVARRQQELGSIQQKQDGALVNKTNNLEKVSELVDWANKTTATVSTLVRQQSEKLESGPVLEGDVANNDKDAPTDALPLLSKDVPSVAELSRLTKESLESLSSQLETLRQEVDKKVEQKKEVQAEILSDKHDNQTSLEGKSAKEALPDQTALHTLEDTIDANRNKITQLDQDIESKLSEFDSKTALMLESLDHQSKSLEKALKERQRIDEEIAKQQELDRLRIQRAQDIENFEKSKSSFVSWSDTRLQELGQLWDNHGYFGKNDETPANGVALLEADTLRFNEEIPDKEAAYHELKDKINSLFSGEEHESERQQHIQAVESAWSKAKAESASYLEITNQMKRWSDLNSSLARFEKEGLDVLDKRIKALAWLHWDAFQPEEEELQKFIETIEDQVRDLKEQGDAVSAIEVSSKVLPSQLALLMTNKAYFEERMRPFSGRIEDAKLMMSDIHDASMEIALRAKFHADLVRVESSVAQQIDAVKARLGSLERSSCFALNSEALSEMVTAAEEVCRDGMYQFQLLQEVEYPALEQMAFDFELQDPEDPAVQSMERIRDALNQLGAYVEEDCFESLLAAKFCTHVRATEEIRRWITSCRDAMAQVDNLDKNQGLMDEAKRKQTMELKRRQLENFERKLNEFASTLQNYDELTGDFMLLRHAASSMPNLADNPLSMSSMSEDVPQVSMRVILRQTVQERAKRTREDWELLKQEFLARTETLDDSSEDEGSDESDVNGAPGRRGSLESTPALKAKALSRLGNEILEDISRVSREVQEMFDHAGNEQSTLSLTVESDGALIKSKDGQARLGMIENYIRDDLQAKVEKFDAMLSVAQGEQDQTVPDGASQPEIPTRSQTRHREKMVGIAMQRGQIAESMKRLVESCHHQRKEVEETVRVQNAMDLIHEVNMLCDAVSKTLNSADNLMMPPAEIPTSLSLYNLPGASSSTSVASAGLTSPRMTPSVSRATLLSRERRANRAANNRSISLSTMSEEEVQQWESTYRAIMAELDGYTEDIEQRLNTVSSMADRLNDWRIHESYGVTSETWQKLKKAALIKKKELDRIWARRHGDGDSPTGTKARPVETQPFASRPSVMQPTASSSNRTRAILGSPVDPTPTKTTTHRKRPSTSTAVGRGSTSGTKTVPTSPTPSFPGMTVRTTRQRSGTVVSQGASASQNELGFKKRSAMSSTPSLASLAMTSTFSSDTKRRTPIIRKNASTASVASMSSQMAETSSPSKPRTPYKPDVNNALDVEVAKVVNASGFPMRVQKLHPGQSPYRKNRDRSDSTSSLAPGMLSDNGGYESATSNSPRAPDALKPLSQWSSKSGTEEHHTEKYLIGDLEPKVCHCRILKNNQVMVRVGGGWCELSKFLDAHASLERRKLGKKLLSGNNSSVSLMSHYIGSASAISVNESRQYLHPMDGYSDNGLSDGEWSGGGGGSGDMDGDSDGRGNNSSKPKQSKKKAIVRHIRPTNGLELQPITFVQRRPGEDSVRKEGMQQQSTPPSPDPTPSTN